MVLVSKIGVLLLMMRIKQPKDKTPTTHVPQGTFILTKICLNWEKLTIRMKRKVCI